MGVAAAGKGQKAIARLVVPAGGRPWCAAERVRTVNYALAAADAASGARRTPRRAEPEAHGVDVSVGLEGVPGRGRQGVQPLVAYRGVTEVPDTPHVVVAALLSGGGLEEVGALTVDEGGDAALEARDAAGPRVPLGCWAPQQQENLH